MGHLIYGGLADFTIKPENLSVGLFTMIFCSSMLKFYIFQTFSESKLLFTFIYERSKPDQHLI